jgi:hypothetical protein
MLAKSCYFHSTYAWSVYIIFKQPKYRDINFNIPTKRTLSVFCLNTINTIVCIRNITMRVKGR